LPTYERAPEFKRDWDRLTADKKRAFQRAVRRFVDDLRGGPVRAGLRIKTFQKVPGWWELTWAPDGRALFSYGREVRPGEKHIIWQRIGSHEIFE
jgi:hypothetical protein